ncbi:hypothetical protein [Parasediminibacterium sp. JCM 36343]|uniref:hypothetical protein n=1 Tax=Parasediminibacterium sp. JCM 36343 TaxID=3374279 RepID=UPI00397C5461
MFKQSIAILFLLAFVAQTFSKAVIVCSFYANQSYIAKNFCENKAKPRSCCAGKCQLKKKLNKDTKEDKQSNERRTGKDSEVLSSKSFFTHTSPCISQEIVIAYTSHTAGKPIRVPRAVFHPPDII